jgi:hypothetical protein
VDSKSLFLNTLKQEFSPLLRSEDFKGSGQNFYRVSADLVHVINIQGSKWGDGYAVNLGLHPLGMRIRGAPISPEPKRLKEYECIFGKRLSPSPETDHWWRHRGFLTTPERSARSIIKCYTKFGTDYFKTYGDAESLLKEFNLNHLSNNERVKIAGRVMTRGRAGMIGAWLAEHLSANGQAAELARFADAHRWEKWPFSAEVVRLQKLPPSDHHK